MQHPIKTLICCALMLGCSTAFADGRGPKWQPLPAAPFDSSCGSTIVHVTFPVNNEFFQETVLSDGTSKLKITGAFVVELATDAGASISVNASGPAREVLPTTGPVIFEFSGTGRTITFLT